MSKQKNENTTKSATNADASDRHVDQVKNPDWDKKLVGLIIRKSQSVRENENIIDQSGNDVTEKCKKLCRDGTDNKATIMKNNKWEYEFEQVQFIVNWDFGDVTIYQCALDAVKPNQISLANSLRPKGFELMSKLSETPLDRKVSVKSVGAKSKSAKKAASGVVDILRSLDPDQMAIYKSKASDPIEQMEYLQLIAESYDNQ